MWQCLELFSMILIFTSLIATSWNVEMGILFPIMGFHIAPLSILYIFFTIASGTVIILLKRMDKNFFLPGCFWHNILHARVKNDGVLLQANCGFDNLRHGFVAAE